MKVVQFFKESTYPTIQEGRYLVGDCGSVYDTKLKINKSLIIRKNHGYIYGEFAGSDDYYDTKLIAIHRLVAWDFVDGYCEETGHIYVDHNDFKKDNNDAENLEWVTCSENGKRRYNNPNNNFVDPPTYHGADHPQAKYDVSLIEKICELLSQGNSVIDIFYTFGYKAQSENKTLYNLIYDIKRKKNWTCISDKYF